MDRNTKKKIKLIGGLFFGITFVVLFYIIIKMLMDVTGLNK